MAILLSTPREIYVLAEHLPHSKPHIQHAMWPCRFCNPVLRAQFEARQKDTAERRYSR